MIQYFDAIVTYLLNSLPISDEFLRHIKIAEPQELSTASFSSIRYFVDKFPVLVQNMTVDTLQEEMVMLQTLLCSQELSIQQDERLDTFWIKINNFQDKESSHPFVNIASFMLSILTVPHSSAHCERVFSMVRKIKTDSRQCLAPDTLQALLVVKHRVSKREFTDSDFLRLKSVLSKKE